MSQYVLLTKEEQRFLLQDLGQYLASREKASICYSVYDMGSFFVEVAYAAGRTNYQSIRPFRSIDILEQYWEEVCLKDLDDRLKLP